ncbi:MAG: ankyrin repeat domain-containing protein [Myxococcales bacterium]|nr:ankyrin repeat domain-containing protein [Myxococcales bacterium]
MHEHAFAARMRVIDRDFKGGEHEAACAAARSLVAEIGGAPVIDGLQMGWAVFYLLRSLHARAEWYAFIKVMGEHEPFLAAIGDKNHAYACSLMVEALYRVGAPAAIPRWGAECCQRRVRDGDMESLGMAIATARNLLGDLGRVDLEVAFLERLIEVGRAGELGQLSLAAQRWALEVAERAEDVALLTDVRRRVVERLPLLRALARDPDADALALLRELAREEWFRALLDPDARRRLELGARLLEPAHRGDADAVLALLDEARDPNLADVMGRTALSVAAFAGQEALVQTLLAREGVDVNQANLQRRAPLAQAADQGHAAIVTRLLAAGADPDARDLNEQTALMLAAWQDHVATVRALLAAGAAVELRDRAGSSALSLAATQDVPEVITALLDGGAALDAASPRGHTALMTAAMEGMSRTLEVLLARGADPSRRDEHGMTARAWAEQEGHAELVARLERAERGA